jgi:hypothetical protein
LRPAMLTFASVLGQAQDSKRGLRGIDICKS